MMCSAATQTLDMPVFDYKALAATPLQRDPFEFVIVDRFIPPHKLSSLAKTFPVGLGGGSHPLAMLKCSAELDQLVRELGHDRFREAVEAKFGLDLKGLPTACTFRTETTLADGNIHTDSSSKIITVLLYLNETWEAEGGRLRLLRSPTDLSDYAAEVAPCGGSLLIFRRSDRSWHGHKEHVGPRKSVQFNWITSRSTGLREIVRHGASHLMKKTGYDWRRLR